METYPNTDEILEIAKTRKGKDKHRWIIAEMKLIAECKEIDVFYPPPTTPETDIGRRRNARRKLRRRRQILLDRARHNKHVRIKPKKPTTHAAPLTPAAPTLVDRSLMYENGDVYEGEFKDAEPHGLGKMTYNDGRVVNGIWEDGRIKYDGELNEKGEPHGKGRWIYYKWWSEDYYDGEWVNGKKHGKGTHTLFDGESYEGEWKHDKRDGQGTHKFTHGSSYEGDWKDDKKHGEGKFKWPDGGSYEGEWKYGKMHGKGTRTWPDGNSYEGEWKDDKRDGKGIMTYANKDIYNGEWKEGLKRGKGKMKYANGDVYEGEFSDDKMHGKGVLEYAEGDLLKCTGEWKEGNKFGLFDVDVRKQVYYDKNCEDKSDSDVKVKLESVYDEDTDTEDVKVKLESAYDEDTDNEDSRLFERHCVNVSPSPHTPSP